VLRRCDAARCPEVIGGAVAGRRGRETGGLDPTLLVCLAHGVTCYVHDYGRCAAAPLRF
jgi:hypothetical protein